MKSVNVDEIHEELIQRKNINFSGFVKTQLGNLVRAYITQIYPECVICQEPTMFVKPAFDDNSIDSLVGLCSSCHASYIKNPDAFISKMQSVCLQKQCDMVLQSNKEMNKFL